MTKNKKMASLGLLIALISAFGVAIGGYMYNKYSGKSRAEDHKELIKGQQELGVKVDSNKKEIIEEVIKRNEKPLDSNENKIKKITMKKDPEIKNEINAPNALIVTQNQSGGNNTVINPQVGIPSPVIKLQSTAAQNEIVKEIATRPRREKISLPSEKYKYDSLYKTTFTILYTCQINLNQIGFRIKRNDVVHLNVTHSGLTMAKTVKDPTGTIFILSRPENGNYTFEVYTEGKFGDILSEMDILR